MEYREFVREMERLQEVASDEGFTMVWLTESRGEKHEQVNIGLYKQPGDCSVHTEAMAKFAYCVHEGIEKDRQAQAIHNLIKEFLV